ncbi:iron complex transport system substrate-binding protein [Catenuloplanes nepalensis]|uniref:Iron complex transport system substrate-binding protein n=1 Tax=Catenuloplanes nepalensis TaxID=587533 RepID=A0ABT9MQG5_9ACTN|nr:ABC transporter substrate-binding protein [Catenuloplanes nepalensis]MDP9793639.1 iron complex transport system substrate-binding protein [Catenuloplanes nepalensis]
MKARLATILAATLLISACGEGPDDTTPAGTEKITINNCGVDVTFDRAPERVVLLKSAAVPYLHSLGVMDRVTARAGRYPKEYYDAATLAELDRIPLLTDRTDTSGHLQISKEVVIAQQPDLVLGEVDNLSRDALSAVDIPLLEEPVLCPGNTTAPTFDSIYAQMETYGRLFDREEEAETAIAALKDRMSKIEKVENRTAAVLYPTVGGGVTYAYGNTSMAHPQLEAAGFTNVFGDSSERVFEVTLEELLGRNPDVIIMIYGDGDPKAVEAAITTLPGADKLKAVQNGDLLVQLFNYTEPASPLSIDGLEKIVERFKAGA